jgi:hypothetical protein
MNAFENEELNQHVLTLRAQQRTRVEASEARPITYATLSAVVIDASKEVAPTLQHAPKLQLYSQISRTRFMGRSLLRSEDFITSGWVLKSAIDPTPAAREDMGGPGRDGLMLAVSGDLYSYNSHGIGPTEGIRVLGPLTTETSMKPLMESEVARLLSEKVFLPLLARLVVEAAAFDPRQ